MTARRLARAPATVTALLAGLALVPAVTAGPATADPVRPPETLRGVWTVTGEGVAPGTEIRFRGRSRGSFELRHPCQGGVTGSNESGAWDWSPEGVLAADLPVAARIGGRDCSADELRARWLVRARSAYHDDLGGWQLIRGRTVLAVLTPKGPRAGQLRSGRVRRAAPLPRRLEPATRRFFRGTWFAARKDGTLKHPRRIAKVRRATYRTDVDCAYGPRWRWSLDPETGALAAAGAGRHGAIWQLSCVWQDDPDVVRHLRLTAVFTRHAARAGRDGRFLVLTDRRGKVVGRYLRG